MNLIPFSGSARDQLSATPPRRYPPWRFCYTHRRLESALTKTRRMLGKAVKVRHCPATVSDRNRRDGHCIQWEGRATRKRVKAVVAKSGDRFLADENNVSRESV